MLSCSMHQAHSEVSCKETPLDAANSLANDHEGTNWRVPLSFPPIFVAFKCPKESGRAKHFWDKRHMSQASWPCRDQGTSERLRDLWFICEESGAKV